MKILSTNEPVDENEDEAQEFEEKSTSKYLFPFQVKQTIQKLFETDGDLIKLIYKSPEDFFIENLMVVPTRIRPPNVVNGTLNTHPMTNALIDILKKNQMVVSKGANFL